MNPFVPTRQKDFLFAGFWLLVLVISCTPNEPPFPDRTGLYLGSSEVIRWHFEEVWDSVEMQFHTFPTRDTFITVSDSFQVIQGRGGPGYISFLEGGIFPRFAGLTPEEFLYEGQVQFQAEDSHSGYYERTLEVHFGEEGKVEAVYYENNIDGSGFNPDNGWWIHFAGEIQ